DGARRRRACAAGRHRRISVCRPVARRRRWIRRHWTPRRGVRARAARRDSPGARLGSSWGRGTSAPLRMSSARSALGAAWFFAASAAIAVPEERLAVIAGANIGGPEDDPLRYAEADARRFRDVLVELGQIRPDRAILSIGGSPEQLLQALVEAR